MKFLIVEDENYVAEILRRSLERMGNLCLIAPSTDAADLLLQDSEVDAVTLDLNLPGTPGVDWLEDIAHTRPQLARRTLVITGQDLDAGLVERLARCGAGVLAKPFTQNGLQNAVRSQIDRPGVQGPR